MLIVFKRPPVAAPSKTVLCKEAIDQVLVGDFVFETTLTIGVGTSCFRLDDERTVFTSLHVGIVKRIDVDGHTESMSRKFLATVDNPITEARCVVGLHGQFVIGIVVVDGTYTLDGVSLAVEFVEDFAQVVGDSFIADDFSLSCVSFEVDVQYVDQP